MARDNDQFDPAAQQETGVLDGKTQDRVGRLGAVRESRRVPEVGYALPGQTPAQRPDYGQPADAGVKNPDRRTGVRAWCG